MRMPQPATGPSSSDGSGADHAAANGAEHATAHDATAAGAAPAPDQTVSPNGHQAGQDGPVSVGSARSAVPAARGVLAGLTAGTAAMVRRVPGLIRETPSMLLRNWLASILIAGGIVMRVLTSMAYHPAIIYIDTLKYLYDAWAGADPVGYKIPLKIILLVGDLGTVEVVQHILGIAMAVAIYLVLLRRGVPRWLAALAIAPVLFDAYQLNVEAMIMPDVWFEAFIVFGLVFLLWQRELTLPMALIGGAILGGSVGLRQVGEILIVPALIIVAAMGGGWRPMLRRGTAVTCGFALAVLLYLSASFQLTGHFWISRSSESLTYGRMSAVVNCATLKVPKIEQPLCPTKSQQANGPDWLDHSAYSPIRTYAATLPANLEPQKDQLIANFNKSVETQQTFRVVTAVLRDSIKLFAITRHTSPGDTPIQRWQFSTTFPSKLYAPWVSIKNGAIWVDTGSLEASSVSKLDPAYGGAPEVDKPVAAFLTSYQLNGGYTPGPLLALSVLLGLIGTLAIFFRKRLTPDIRFTVVACVAFFTTAVLILGISDAFEFTWRYQDAAIMTLPPAGALGIAVLIQMIRRRRNPQEAAKTSEQVPELTAPAQ